uniref:Golgin-84 n=1 Tax=Angiostrongylus cantonensis TaxID=6313 RepID=A0A158P853_ANGCA
MVSSNATSPTSGPLLSVPVTEIGSVLKLHGDRDLSAEAAHVDSKQDFSNSQSPSIEANEGIANCLIGNHCNFSFSAFKRILEACINVLLREFFFQDIAKMWLLKSELENTVEALKGEIWSLNSQLKASILDREQLQDRVVQLDSSLEAEKKRADALDCELSEQTELTEKATRQAAEAENESNRRLAECLEMETRREQVEKAYAQLSDYYSQLQAAYNVIYAQLKQLETERENNSKQQNVIVLIAFNVKFQLEEHQMAIAEHRRTNEALHEQLRCIEEETQNIGGESRDSKARLLQLEGDLHWKQDECVSLRRKVDEVCALGAIAATPSSRLRIELAILAAKLATRQADVDALFRANAELAHTNVRLQNELDQSEDRVVSTNHDVFCDGELQVSALSHFLSLLINLHEIVINFYCGYPCGVQLHSIIVDGRNITHVGGNNFFENSTRISTAFNKVPMCQPRH